MKSSIKPLELGKISVVSRWADAGFFNFAVVNSRYKWEMPSDRIASLAAEWTRAKAGALDFIDAMPEPLLGYQPVPEVFSFAEQMIHIGAVNYMFASSATGVSNPYGKASGKEPDKDAALKSGHAALREFVGGSYDFMLSAIGTLGAGELDETVEFHQWTMTRDAMIAKAMEHHAHHRGQTVIYFRLNRLKPPSEHLF